MGKVGGDHQVDPPRGGGKLPPTNIGWSRKGLSP